MINGGKVMNIIQTRVINQYGDASGTKYIFKAPEGVEIKKDTLLLAERAGGKEGTQIVKSITDSAEVSEVILEMLMGGCEVVSSIIGELRLIKCEDMQRHQIDAKCAKCLWFRGNYRMADKVCNGKEKICHEFIEVEK